MIKPLFTEKKLKFQMDRVMLELKKIKDRGNSKGEQEYVELDDMLCLFVSEFRLAKTEIQKHQQSLFLRIMKWKNCPTEMTGSKFIEIMEAYKKETKF